MSRKRFDKNGRQLKKISFRRATRIETTVTIHHAKVFDNSNGNGERKATDAEVKKAGQTMAKEIQDTWSGTSTDGKGRTATTTVKFDGEVEVVHSTKETKKSDVVFTINEDGKTGGPNVWGRTMMGSGKIGLDFRFSYLPEAMSRSDNHSSEGIALNQHGQFPSSGGRVVSHEVGHTGGLPDTNPANGTLMGGMMGQPSFNERKKFFRGR